MKLSLPVCLVVSLVLFLYSILSFDVSHARVTPSINGLYPANAATPHAGEITRIASNFGIPSLYAIIVLAHNENNAKYVFGLLCALFVQSAFVAGIKYETCTLRPNGNPNGYVSGHTCSAATTCLYIITHMQMSSNPHVASQFVLSLGLLAYMFWTGVERILVNAHSLADINGAIALAMVVVFICFCTVHRLKTH